MMKVSQATLDKIERVLDEAEYIVRYERGNFQSGYCILEQKKVVVLNKFLQLEGRISTLVDIIPQLKVTPELLSPEVKKIYDEVLHMAHQLREQEAKQAKEQAVSQANEQDAHTSEEQGEAPVA